MGIFKRVPLNRGFDDDADIAPLSLQKLTTKLENGSVVSFRTVNINDVEKVLPSKDEYDLEAQLRAGVKPQKINVHGLLDDPSVLEANALNAINDIINQVENEKSTQVENVESSNE